MRAVGARIGEWTLAGIGSYLRRSRTDARILTRRRGRTLVHQLLAVKSLVQERALAYIVSRIRVLGPLLPCTATREACDVLHRESGQIGGILGDIVGDNANMFIDWRLRIGMAPQISQGGRGRSPYGGGYGIARGHILTMRQRSRMVKLIEVRL